MATDHALARAAFQISAQVRWELGRAKYGPTLQMRHPVAEALEEAQDMFNYLKLAPGVSRDLVWAVESLGTTLLLKCQELRENGVDLTAPWPSSASSTPRTS